MSERIALTARLRETILDEIFYAFGAEKDGWSRRCFGFLFWPFAQRFARLVAAVDQDIAEHGMQLAAQNLSKQFLCTIDVNDADRIPRHGPLLVACNHPGAFDSVVAIASLPRPDLKVVVSGVPFLESLPAASPRFIYAPGDPHKRMQAVRHMIRHLQQGGALLIFATGIVDPDPAVLPGAHEAIEDWSPSLAIALRRAPGTRFQPAIISGVLASAALRNPIIHTQREPWKKRRLAEYFQVMGQLAFGRAFDLSPSITFGRASTLEELRQASGEAADMPAIIYAAQKTLETHCARLPGEFQKGVECF